MSLCYRSMMTAGDRKLLNAAVIQKHYLHRLPSISYGFGAFAEDDARIKGVMTVGKPASITMLRGVAGLEQSVHVYEFNRLWMTDELPRTIVGRDGRRHSTGHASHFVAWMQRWFCRTYPDAQQVLARRDPTEIHSLANSFWTTRKVLAAITKQFKQELTRKEQS
jgi:hypothetical protein